MLNYTIILTYERFIEQTYGVLLISVKNELGKGKGTVETGLRPVSTNNLFIQSYHLCRQVPVKN